MTGSLNVFPWDALYMRKAQRQKPPTISNRLMGSSRRKKSPLVRAPSTRPAIIQTIHKPTHATLKKMDWNEWKRTKRSDLKGSRTRKRMPVTKPAKYVRAAAVLGCKPLAAGAAVAATAPT